jgi:hypothetical protein
MTRQFVALPISLPRGAPRAKLSLVANAAGTPFFSMKLMPPVKKLPTLPVVAPPPEEFTGGLGIVLAAIVNEASRPVVVPALPLDIPRDAEIFQVGGDIRVSRLIERAWFRYPEIAKTSHVFGKVIIAAVIDETGRVTQARLISGPGSLLLPRSTLCLESVFNPP